jgi:hypothetical protein
MRKLFSLLAGMFLMAGFFVSANTSAAVPGQYLDQAYEASIDTCGYAVVGNFDNYGRFQTFTPTVNKITSIEVYLKDQIAGKRLNIKVKKESDGSTVKDWTSTSLFVGGAGWVSVSYDSPFVAVTPGTTYGIYASITGDTQTKWAWNMGNPYAGGKFMGGAGEDAFFRVYGTKDQASGDTPATGTGVTDTSTSKYANLVTNASIKTPVLTAISKNGVTTKAPITEEVSLGTHDKLILNGTSFAGAKVVLYMSDKVADALVAKDGTWTYELEGSKLSSGTMAIQGQAIQGTEGSEKAEFMKIKVLGVKTGSSSSDKSWFAGWNIFYTLIGVGVLLLALLLLALIARRHQKGKTGEKPKQDKEEEKGTKE